MDTTLFFEDCAWLREWPGTPIGDEEGRIISEALGDKKAILLAHHGELTATGSVEHALVLAMFVERAAKLQLMAMSAGTILQVDRALAQEAHDYRHKPKAIAATFAYYARRVIRQDASVLD
jgi:L-fuculose-phosphate aldolase